MVFILAISALVLSVMLHLLAVVIAFTGCRESRSKTNWGYVLGLVVILMFEPIAHAVSILNRSFQSHDVLFVFVWLSVGILLVVGLSAVRRRMLRTMELENARDKVQDHYNSFLNNFHGIAFLGTLDFVPIFFHGAVRAITGYEEDDFLAGRPRWDQVVHPDDLPRILSEDAPRLRGEPNLEIEREYRICRKDGYMRWVRETIGNVVDRAGRIAYIQGAIYDITERKAAEERLVRERSQLAALMQTLSDKIYFKDRESRFIRVNRAMLGFFGVKDMSQVAGKTDSDFFTKEHAREAFADEQKIMQTGQSIINKEEKETWPDGRVTWSSTTKMPLRDDTGAIVGLFGVSRDITERKRADEKMLHAQKMEAIGQLAGGIAHDFNNLLTGILGYAELLKRNLAQSGPEHEAAITIEQAAVRASDLTRQLLGFARPGRGAAGPVDIHKVVDEVINLLDRTFDKSISIVQRYHPGPVMVQGDSGQLQQVILNLAVNARDAMMPKGGELTIETALVDLDEKYCRLNGGMSPGEYVVVNVTDTGCGIPPEIRGRIFEPFFTTKESGKGTGMGLALVYSIVKGHGGFVQLYSEVRKGTTFKVFLPSLEDVPAEQKLAAADIARGHGMIMVVDDEEIIRNLTRDMLMRIGYKVVTIPSGAEAVRYFREAHGQIDLVIIDMAMPEMSGTECFSALKAIEPEVRAILSTGYGMNSKASEAMKNGMCGFVQKPFRLADLADAVARALKVSENVAENAAENA